VSTNFVRSGVVDKVSNRDSQPGAGSLLGARAGWGDKISPGASRLRPPSASRSTAPPRAVCASRCGNSTGSPSPPSLTHGKVPRLWPCCRHPPPDPDHQGPAGLMERLLARMKVEARDRYPRHVWPNGQPTTRAKLRGTW